MMYDPVRMPLVFEAAAETGRPVDIAGIMHTPANVVSDALKVLNRTFNGPLVAYPDSGYFQSPHWQFMEVIEPAELHRYADTWVEAGAQVVGGCCGLSPVHIAALAPLKRGPTTR